MCAQELQSTAALQQFDAGLYYARSRQPAIQLGVLTQTHKANRKCLQMQVEAGDVEKEGGRCLPETQGLPAGTTSVCLLSQPDVSWRSSFPRSGDLGERSDGSWMPNLRPPVGIIENSGWISVSSHLADTVINPHQPLITMLISNMLHFCAIRARRGLAAASHPDVEINPAGFD